MFKYISNLTIKTKLILGFGSLLFLSMILVINNFLTLQALSEHVERIVQLRVPTQRVGVKLEEGVKKSHTALTSWALTHDRIYSQQRKAAWEHDILPALETLDELSKRWTEPNNFVRLTQIKKLLSKLQDYQEQIEQINESSSYRTQLIQWLSYIRFDGYD